MALVIKNLPANAGDIMLGSIPELGRSPGGGHGNPLWYSCLENPMDRGAWWAAVHAATKSRMQLNDGAQARIRQDTHKPSSGAQLSALLLPGNASLTPHSRLDLAHRARVPLCPLLALCSWL